MASARRSLLSAVALAKVDGEGGSWSRARKPRAMVQESAVSWSGFQRARRLFGLPAIAVGEGGTVMHRRNGAPGGMQRGRAAGPLARMARGHRAHLVFVLNAYS